MLTYGHSRGISVEPPLYGQKLARFQIRGISRNIPIYKYKNASYLFHHADEQKAYDKDMLFFSKQSGNTEINTGSFVLKEKKFNISKERIRNINSLRSECRPR